MVFILGSDGCHAYMVGGHVLLGSYTALTAKMSGLIIRQRFGLYCVGLNEYLNP